MYEDITRRTQGDIYIGVVGPVRTGKSTFIKRFMETLVLPRMDNEYRRERARDELPQSGSGRVVMTAEPKFVPEEAVEIEMDNGALLSVRLIDCVGYLVPGALGQMDGDAPRMVRTPWVEGEIPMSEAAEMGTRKVIAEHSTLGIVVTTDGTVADIPREDYEEAEERVIGELKALGKPFVLLLNSANPGGEEAAALRRELAEKYDVTCLAVNCLTLGEEAVSEIIKGVLWEFPMKELDITLPPWVDALPTDHPIKSGLFDAIREELDGARRLRDLKGAVERLDRRENIAHARLERMDMGCGVAGASVEVERELFYTTLSQRCGLEVADDGDLMRQMCELAAMKGRFQRVEAALDQVERLGYGIVMPDIREMTLEEPEIVRQGGRYGVRLRASAPSIHLMRADIRTEVSPMMGSEKQSEEMMDYLLSRFEGDTGKLWDTDLFGRSLHELVAEDLQAKLRRMPDDARDKLRETLQRILNEGSGGLICIIL